jgi:hypothetical protein
MSETRIQQIGEPAVVEASDGRLTRLVPIRIKRPSGRKLVPLPSGETLPPRPWVPPQPRCNWRSLVDTDSWRCSHRGGQIAQGDRYPGRGSTTAM